MLTGAQMSYNQSMRFGAVDLIERCAEDRIKDEENLNEIEQEDDEGEEEENQLDEEEMRDTIGKKLTGTHDLENEMLEEELEGTIIGAIDHHKYQDESTRRDANTTGRTTGLSFQPMLFQSTAIEHLINEAENSVSHRSKEENELSH